MMKHFVILLMLIFLVKAAIFGQILNGSFENWTDGTPDNWQTDNGGGLTPVTQTSVAHSGHYAVKGISVRAGGGAAAKAPVLVSGSKGEGFSIDFRPTSLHGFYMYTPSDVRLPDSFYVRVTLSKKDTVVGYGFFGAGTLDTSYQEFVAIIQYFSNAVPDTVHIRIELNIFSNTARPHFFLDDLFFRPIVGVREANGDLPTAYTLSQNFPNPFNPKTTIRFSLPQSNYVTMKVFNLLGQEVARLVSEQLSAGTHTAEWNAGKMESGVYFYRIQAGTFTGVKKMILLK